MEFWAISQQADVNMGHEIHTWGPVCKLTVGDLKFQGRVLIEQQSITGEHSKIYSLRLLTKRHNDSRRATDIYDIASKQILLMCMLA